ncbi:MAG TPA: hypothetical protein DC024_11835 [Clostridiales bacterium]|nr:hypothetical protein [Clostridiales bacterium]HCS10106.1 hypothetical protein [Clostridiales bacterium]
MKSKKSSLKSTCLPAGRGGKLMKICDPYKLPNSTLVWYVYVILCDDGSLYKGFTNNLRERYIQHNTGKGAKHTKSHKPIAVVYYEEKPSEEEAVKREKYFKSGSGREWLKKELVKGRKDNEQIRTVDY